MPDKIFFDYLNTSTRDFSDEIQIVARQDKQQLNYRYGGKLNIGYTLFSRLNIFGIAGLTNVRYTINWPSVDDSRSSAKIAPIYGAGISYDINNDWLLRAIYEQQNFNIQYVDEGSRSVVELKTARLGLSYKF